MPAPAKFGVKLAKEKSERGTLAPAENDVYDV